MITNLLFGYVIRRVGKRENYLRFRQKNGNSITGGGIDRLLAEVFRSIHSECLQKPMEALEN